MTARLRLDVAPPHHTAQEASRPAPTPAPIPAQEAPSPRPAPRPRPRPSTPPRAAAGGARRARAGDLRDSARRSGRARASWPSSGGRFARARPRPRPRTPAAGALRKTPGTPRSRCRSDWPRLWYLASKVFRVWNAKMLTSRHLQFSFHSGGGRGRRDAGQRTDYLPRGAPPPDPAAPPLSAAAVERSSPRRAARRPARDPWGRQEGRGARLCFGPSAPRVSRLPVACQARLRPGRGALDEKTRCSLSASPARCVTSPPAGKAPLNSRSPTSLSPGTPPRPPGPAPYRDRFRGSSDVSSEQWTVLL